MLYEYTLELMEQVSCTVPRPAQLPSSMSGNSTETRDGCSSLLTFGHTQYAVLDIFLRWSDESIPVSCHVTGGAHLKAHGTRGERRDQCATWHAKPRDGCQFGIIQSVRLMLFNSWSASSHLDSTRLQSLPHFQITCCAGTESVTVIAT